MDKYSDVYAISSHVTYLAGDSAWVGGVVVATNSNISISQCSFKNNKAQFGGVMFLMDSNATIDTTAFTGNHAGRKLPRGSTTYYLRLGGVIYHERSHINITNCQFVNNC